MDTSSIQAYRQSLPDTLNEGNAKKTDQHLDNSIENKQDVVSLGNKVMHITSSQLPGDSSQVNRVYDLSPNVALPSIKKISVWNIHDEFDQEEMAKRYSDQEFFSGTIFHPIFPNNKTGFYKADYVTEEENKPEIGIILRDLKEDNYYVAPGMLPAAFNRFDQEAAKQGVYSNIVKAVRDGNRIVYYDRAKEQYRIIDFSDSEEITIRDLAPQKAVTEAQRDAPAQKKGFLTPNKLLILFLIIFGVSGAGSIPSIITAGLHKVPEYFYYIGGALGGIALTSGALAVMIGGVRLWRHYEMKYRKV